MMTFYPILRYKRKIAMKMRHFVLSTLTTLCVVLIACSAVIKKPSSPEEALIAALRNGENYISEGQTFNRAIDFNQIFEDEASQSLYIDSELRFTNCTFKGKISWAQQESRKLYFQKALIFEDCVFDDEVILNDAIFKGVFQIGKGTFRKSLDLQRNSFLLTCRIDESAFGQDLLVQYSKCHEELSLFGNSIGNHLLLQGISVYGKSQLSNLEIHGTVDLSNAHFHEDFMMDYAKGGKKVLGGNSKFNSRCFVRNIAGFDMVDFSGSYFLGKRIYTSVEDTIKPNMAGSFILTEAQ